MSESDVSDVCVWWTAHSEWFSISIENSSQSSHVHAHTNTETQTNALHSTSFIEQWIGVLWALLRYLMGRLSCDACLMFTCACDPKNTIYMMAITNDFHRHTCSFLCDWHIAHEFFISFYFYTRRKTAVLYVCVQKEHFYQFLPSMCGESQPEHTRTA